MISVYRSTPRKYYDDSRDFQFIGRLFEALFNYLKMNVDLAQYDQLSSNSDVRMLPLLAKTLGFESKHEYNTEDLKALCSSFASILRKKGSIGGIEDAVNAFLSAQNIGTEAYPSRNPEDYMDLTIYLPEDAGDTALLEDVFDYILPAGMTYNFVRAQAARDPSTTELRASSRVTHGKYFIPDLGRVTRNEAEYNPAVDPAVNASRPDQFESKDKRDKLTSMSTFALGAVVGGPGTEPKKPETE